MQILRPKKLKNQPQSQPTNKAKQSPNLLKQNTEEKKDFFEKHHFQIVGLAKITVIVVELGFIFIMLANSNITSSIGQLQNQVKNLEEKITAESKVEAEIRSISKRIELIKRLGEQRKDYTELVVNTISLLGDGVGLEKSGFKENKVSLSVETQTPIEVSYLIDRYFEAKAADQITITSARLNKNTETYITDLEFE